MTRPDRKEGGDDDVDPWAPGGAMAHAPRSPRPDATYRFTSIDAATPAAWGHSQSETSSLAAMDSRPGSAPVDAGGRRGLWLAGAALMTAIAIGAVLIGADDDENTTPDMSETSVPSSAADDDLAATAAPREFIVDVVPELDAINPTEIVALGESGLYEISLPSGRVRVTDLGFTTDGAHAVANDQVAVVWPTPELRAQAIGIDGTMAVPEPEVNSVSWSPSTNQMYLWTEQATGAIATELSVRDLVLQWQVAHWLDPADGTSPLIDLDGALLRRDTGGIYRVDSLSTDLLTTGDVVATGANHLLLRECDTTRSCSLFTLDRAGDRRSWSVDLPPDVTPQLVGGLSPGGDALLFNRQRIATDVARDIAVFELTDGALRSLRAPPSQESTAAWDTNGAGVFVADSVLVYIDRFTGATTVVSADLPILRSASVRRPAATPLCEVLAISHSRFALMAAGGDTNTASPPAPNVLDRLVELLPTELIDPTAPMIDFVTGFVSAEVADSQTVANWPADVRVGLDALDSYAAAECPLIDV